MSVRAVITFIVIAGTVSIGLLYAVATLDPLTATVTGYDLNGMESQVDGIHKMLVQYMVLVAIGSPLLWVVFRILRKERQQV